MRIFRSISTLGLLLALSLVACRSGDVSPVSPPGPSTASQNPAEKEGSVAGQRERVTQGDRDGRSPDNVLCMLTGPIIREDIQVGGILADELHELLVKQGFRIGVQGSSNPYFNLEAINAGSADLALVPAQFFYRSTIKSGGIPAHLGIRSLCHLSTTAMTLLATDRSGIQTVSELRGRRVGLVRPANSDRKTLNDLLTSVDLTAVDIPLDAGLPSPPREGRNAPAAVVYVSEGKKDRIEAALQAGTIDALFTAATHPSTLVLSALGRCPVHFVQIAIEMERIGALNPAYEEATIPHELYPELRTTGDIHSVGSPMVLVASASLSEERAYQLVAAISEKVSQIKATPYFHGFSLSEMVDGLKPAFIHPGARRYYLEKRLIVAPVQPVDSGSNSMTLAWAPPTVDREQLAHALAAEPSGQTLGTTAAPTGEAAPLSLMRDSAPASLSLEPFEGFAMGAPGPLNAPETFPGPLSQAFPAFSASEPARVVTGTAINEVSALFARVSGNSRYVALVPAYAIPESSISAVDSGERLERRNIRGLLRLPGPVLHVVADKDTELATLQSGPAEALGFARDVPSTLLPCLRQELGIIGRTSTGPEESPSDQELLSRFLSGEYKALVIAGPVPSALVRQALSVRGSHLLSLPAPEQQACGKGVVEPELVLSSGYPVALAGRALPTWMLPEALFVSATAPANGVETLLNQALMLLTGGDPASPRSAKGTSWGLKGLQYPLHPAAAALKPETRRPAVPPVREDRTLTLGSGSVEDPSFSVALTLVRYLNRYCLSDPACITARGKRVRGAVLPTLGFEEAVSAVLRGGMTFGLARADVLYAAIQGEGRWKGKPQKSLSVLATLYVPALTVLVTERQRLDEAQKVPGAPPSVTSADLNGSIRALTDLEGRRTSLRRDLLRSPRDNAITLFRIERFLDSQWRYALTTQEPFPMVGANMFSGGTVEALISLTAHPNVVIASLLQRDAHAHLIPVTGLDERLAELPYMSRALINSAAYGAAAGQERLIPTFGIPVVLFTLEDTPAEEVRPLLDAIAGAIDRIRKDNPILSMISMDLLQAPSVAPFHPEATTKYGLVAPTDEDSPE